MESWHLWCSEGGMSWLPGFPLLAKGRFLWLDSFC